MFAVKLVRSLAGIFDSTPPPVKYLTVKVVFEGAIPYVFVNKNPIEMLGHVTSSYFSPNLNKSIALAVVRGGKDMMGKKLFIPMEDKTINVTVSNPVFFDQTNERLNA